MYRLLKFRILSRNCSNCHSYHMPKLHFSSSPVLYSIVRNTLKRRLMKCKNNESIIKSKKIRVVGSPATMHVEQFSSYSKDYYRKETIQKPVVLEEIPTEFIQDHLDHFSLSKEEFTTEILEDPVIRNEIIAELKNVDVIRTEDDAKRKKSGTKKRLKEKEKKEIAVKLSELEKQAREEGLNRTILAYVDLCVAQNKTNRGLQAILFYINRAHYNKSSSKLKNVAIFNALLEGFAGTGNYSKLISVLGTMKREKIPYNLQTFVAIFECLGRLPENESLKLLNGYLKQLEDDKWTVNDLLNDGKFINDRREVVITAIQRLYPDFIPKYRKPELQYVCELLTALNHHDQTTILETILENRNYQREAFLNSNINQLDFYNLQKTLSNEQVRFKQFTFNISNLLLQFAPVNMPELVVVCNTNTYDPIASCGFLNNENNEKISSSSRHHDQNMLFTATDLKARAKEQMKIESDGYVLVDSIEKRNAPTELINHYRSKLSETQVQWGKIIKAGIERDLLSLQSQTDVTGGSRGSPSLHACLQALPIDELTQIVLQEVRKLAEGSETYSPTLMQLYREIGTIVHSRYQVRLKQQNGVLEKVDRIYEKYCDWYSSYYHTKDFPRTINPRQYWQALAYADQCGASLDLDDKVWPYTLIIAVGKFLYNIIMKDLKIDVNALKLKSKQNKHLPAFYTLFRTQGHITKEEVKAHPVVTKLFRGAASPQITFQVNHLPMVCPPRPWAHYTAGGYLVVHTDMLRLPSQATQQMQRLASAHLPSLYPSFDSLNQLAAIPWTVNEKILDLVLDVFRSGGNARLGVAPPPETCPNPAPLSANATKTERFQAFRQRMAVRRRKAEMYSLWCDALYRLSLANHFRKKTFWLPHNMDFRGRVYPVPPHLTHLGADLARSILIFAEKQPLGADGLKWLKLHLVNLLGTKKKNSVAERLQYADSILEEIYDSADKPLNGRMWWAESEEPWQTLACCIEITNALRSGDPTKYMCNFPVHQDGSCNGLQHYAALGRDAAGAVSVNLSPAEYPQDVYSAVVALVERQRQKDAADGLRIAQTLEGFVKRKVIKQTVMTTVYGVTRFGARLQIAKQLKDIEDFPKESVWQASSYLTVKTFDSLRTMFTSTRQIQDWFTDCARLISSVCAQNVEWITPLGLPIVQPYSRFRKIDIATTNRIPESFSMDTFERPNTMKQKNAFPPNFIHSLDSSHMMLTSLYCERQGVSFVSVHDCFWTHPNTVPIMNQICREQFVALHSQPILEDLSRFLCNKYMPKESTNKNEMEPSKNVNMYKVLYSLPATGDFRLDAVLNSTYFFS